MADVKWIKLSTGLPDNKKIKQIRTLPNGDSIALMWVFLMCLAGDTNEDGLVYFTPEIPFTDEMLAEEFRMDVNTVRLALQTFVRFEMIEIVDDIICLTTWEKWQSADELANIREKTRKRVAKHRAKQKLLAGNASCNVTGNVTVTPCNAIEGEIEEEIDKESDKEGDKEKKVNYQQIVDLYNETCVSFPRLRSLSDARKKAIKARLNTYTLDDFKLLFEKAEASSFLKGSNGRNWTATFDWLIQDSNMAKVLDGNYDERQSTGGRKEMVPAWMKKKQPDYQPTPERIKKNGEWLDGFLAEQEAEQEVKEDADLQARAEQLKKQLTEKYGKGDSKL